MGGVLSTTLGHGKAKLGLDPQNNGSLDSKETVETQLLGLFLPCGHGVSSHFFYHNRPEVRTNEEPNHVFDSQS